MERAALVHATCPWISAPVADKRYGGGSCPAWDPQEVGAGLNEHSVALHLALPYLEQDFEAFCSSLSGY